MVVITVGPGPISMCNSAGNSLQAGSYIAILGDSWASPGNAADRVTSDGPYYRPDGVEIATSKADLYKGSITNPVDVDDQGHVDSDCVYTASDSNGEYVNADCFGWGAGAGWESNIGYYGNSAATDGTWLNVGPTVVCSTLCRIYCIQN